VIGLVGKQDDAVKLTVFVHLQQLAMQTVSEQWQNPDVIGLVN
jgi:hypothetical protein